LLKPKGIKPNKPKTENLTLSFSVKNRQSQIGGMLLIGMVAGGS